MVGILLSYWDGLFSGAMLVSGRVMLMRYDMTLGMGDILDIPTFAQKSRPYNMSSFCKGPLEWSTSLVPNKVCGIALQDSGAAWLDSGTPDGI